MADFTGDTLTYLNNFMKTYPSGRIVPEEILNFPLLEALKPSLNTTEFFGSNVQILIEGARPLVGQVTYENADIPLPGHSTFNPMQFPIRQLITNAGLTMEALDQATGGAASWGRIVDRKMRQREEDWDNLLNTVLWQNGSGYLGRIVSAAEVGSTTVLTFDNTYNDSGIENVGLCKVGMVVEVVDITPVAACETDTAGNSSWTIEAVSFGDRNNGAATTGTITLTGSTGLAAKLADNDCVFLVGSFSSALTQPAPQGLTAFLQGSGDNFSGYAALTTFQNVTRASYDNLKGRVYAAGDFAVGGVDNTPDDWDLSVIADAFQDVARGSGRGKVDLLLAPMPIARAIQRLNRSENSMTVQVASVPGMGRTASGGTAAMNFEAPDGRIVPIRVVDTIPDNCLVGLTTQDLTWHVKGSFDNIGPRLGFGVWMMAPGRKRNFEAPFGGYMQVTAERCDNCFLIQDLKTNV